MLCNNTVPSHSNSMFNRRQLLAGGTGDQDAEFMPETMKAKSEGLVEATMVRNSVAGSAASGSFACVLGAPNIVDQRHDHEPGRPAIGAGRFPLA